MRRRKCSKCSKLLPEGVAPQRRLCTACKDLSRYTITTSNPTRNTQGTRRRKPRTKRSKRQNPNVMGSVPELRLSNWGMN